MAEVTWVRFQDKFPEDGQKLLVLSDRGTVTIKKYNKGAARRLSSGVWLDGFGTSNTVYWAELPDPPKEFLEARKKVETQKLEGEIKRLEEKLKKLRGEE